MPGRTRGITPRAATIRVTDRKISMTVLHLVSVSTYEKSSGAPTGSLSPEVREAKTPAGWPERSLIMSDVTRRISRWKAKYSPEIAAQTTAR
ncbi:MAG: hypothetical protein NTX53_03340, partial [candidate division WOR-3 bacterium]|nr:hypothetical protein [candidate division WOR-3 bacterium]